MPRSTAAGLLLISVSASLPAADAQGIIGGQRHVSPGHLLDGATVPHALSMKRTFTVVGLPADAVQLTEMPQWNPSSRARQGDYPKEALVVQRDRGRVPAPCTPGYDRVFLRAAISREFRLIRFNALPLTPPAGYAAGTPLEAILLPREPTIQIRIPIFAQRQGNALACWSGYRLSIALEGPAGVEPFTANHYGAGGSRPR